MRSSLERGVLGSNPEPVKLDSVLPSARHRYDVYSKGAMLRWRNNSEMGPAKICHTLPRNTGSITKHLISFALYSANRAKNSSLRR